MYYFDSFRDWLDSLDNDPLLFVFKLYFSVTCGPSLSLSLSLLHSLQLIIQIRLKQIVPHTQREDGCTEVTVLGLWSAPGKVLYGGGQEAGGEEGRPDCSRKTK